MTKKLFKLQQVDLLPPLMPEEVDNLIKFLRLNASRLTDLTDFESCCASDDAEELQGFVYDALRLGYGTPEDLAKYLAENDLNSAGERFDEDDADDNE